MPDSGTSTPLSRATPGPQSSLDEASSVSSQSESDNDFEPEQQVAKYLALKSRLYEINPELAELNPRKQKRNAAKTCTMKVDQGHDTDRRIGRLTAKLNKIKSDILFDEDEANQKWADIHFDLAKETAERRRLDIRNEAEQVKPTASSSGQSNEVNAAEQNEDSGQMLGELFFGLPDTTTDLATPVSNMNTTDTGGTTVEIREFEKWTGMSPRRVFEEACRARWA
jgi:ATP-dependent RNA helicase DHX29